MLSLFPPERESGNRENQENRQTPHSGILQPCPRNSNKAILVNTNIPVTTNATANVSALFSFARLISFAQPWLLLFQGRSAFFLADAQSFSFFERLWRLF
jgi:hypothetical protein